MSSSTQLLAFSALLTTMVLMTCCLAKVGSASSQTDSKQLLQSNNNKEQVAIELNENDPISRMILERLAAINQQQQQPQQQASSSRVLKKHDNSIKNTKSNNDHNDKSIKSLLLETPQQPEATIKKMILKKKLGKLLDDLIEAEQNAESSNVDEIKLRRKKWTPKLEASNEGNEQGSIKITLRDPLEMQRDLQASNSPLLSSNKLWNSNNLAHAENVASAATTPARVPVNLNSHNGRILDDKFGIIKESTFSTNNHLGLKGVPKFGSDEEY